MLPEQIFTDKPDDQSGREPVMIGCADIGQPALAALFAPYGLSVQWLPPDAPIPGSHWGAPEAGLIAHTLYVRPDTPLHSALHEGCHYICMTPERRAMLHTDAGGDDLEESAVCYLQLILADRLPQIGLLRLATDMDAWGYSFRLGRTLDWFEQDAGDARDWLQRRGLPTR